MQSFFHGTNNPPDKFTTDGMTNNPKHLYGMGVYFTSDPGDCEQYRGIDGTILECTIASVKDFPEWDQELYDNQRLMKRLADLHPSEAEEIQGEIDSYGEYWTIAQYWGHLRHVMSPEELRDLFCWAGIYGVRVSNTGYHSGEVVAVYQADLIRIIGPWGHGE